VHTDQLTLHPRNEGFVWEDRTGPFRRLTAEQVAGFDRDGFVVLERAIPEDELATLVAEIDPMEAELEELLRQVEDGKVFIARADEITFTTHLVARSPSIRAFASSPLFADLCHDLVGPDVRFYWDQAVYKKPEKPRRFPWHQDNGYKYLEPQAYLTCWVPLTDATEANGCPQVATGLHRLGTLKHHYVDPLGWEIFEAPPEQPAIAEARKGSVVVFSSLTPHLTGPNTTDAVRKAYILQYAPEGAYSLDGDPNQGPPTGRTTQDNAGYQYPVIRAGQRV